MDTKKTTQPPSRLLSLDLMRGLVMVLLMIESTHLYARLRPFFDEGTLGARIVGQFFHNDWTGLNFWDLVQPAFMFMAGVAMTYSLKKQKELGTTWRQRFCKVMRRGGWLVLWGIVKRISSPDWLAWQALDLTDILTQLAFASVIAFLVSGWSIRNRLLAILGILLLTDALYRFISIPGHIEGYTDGRNFGSYLDWLLFHQASNHYVFINWLPTSVHTIAGGIVGSIFINQQQYRRPLLKTTAVAILALALGYGLDALDVIPIIKPIATTSFVIASLGYCLLALVLFHWWIDLRHHNKQVLFFQIVGTNSLFIYLFCDIIGRQWLNHYATLLLGPLEHTFGLPHPWLLLISSTCVFAFEWSLCLFLFRRKIFFKV